VSETVEEVDDSTAALTRYARSMHRQRLIYLGVVALVVVALAVGVSIAWSHGEVANTTLHTVPKAPSSLAIGSPTQSPQVAWRTSDRAAIGTPQRGGTVVVYSNRTVRGVDARTGAQTWSYTRTNRTVCSAAQIAGTTIAIYELHGNCDEVTALDSGTGTRKWTRTLDFDGQPLNGHPTYQMLSYTLMITSPSVIYALDPSSGYNRWTYSRYGCTIEHAALGSEGALISQNCTNPKCGKLKFCGRGPQLLMRNGIDGTDDKSETNPDRIKWNVLGDTDIPVSADALVSALNTTTRSLDVLDPKTGKPRGPVTISPAPPALSPITAVSASGNEVIWIGGVAYAVRPNATTPDWSAATPGPPTVVSTTGEDNPTLPTARVTVPSSDGIRILDGNTGQTAQSFAVPPPEPGSLVYPLGNGFLVAAPSATVAYK
jgi:outer membrane protein assembly factor BamB